MEEKLRQAPSSQGQPSNTLKEERSTSSSAPVGFGTPSKQEKFVEVGGLKNLSSLKSEVPNAAKNDSPQGARGGFPAEEKLREIVNPDEDKGACKEEGSAKLPPKGSDSSKVDEKLYTPFAGSSAADAPPKEIQPKAYNEKKLKSPQAMTAASQSASSPALPAEQKLKEIPNKLPAAQMKQDAVPCCKEAGQTESPSPKGQPSVASYSPPKEEKVNKAPGSTAPPSGVKEVKEEKLQEAAPTAAAQEQPAPSSSQAAASSGAQPADASPAPSCCSCF